MFDLSRFFTNPFAGDDISIVDLIAYTNEHRERMVANNPGALFNVRINATTVALNALDLTLTDTNTKLGVQKGRTQAKFTFRRNLFANIARVHGAVVSAFGPNTPELMTIFPQGREVFQTCTDGALENHLQQLQTAVTAQVAKVGQPTLDNVGGLLSTWVALYAEATTARASTNTTAEARRTASTNLRMELFKNVLMLAMQYPGQPEKAAVYCPQHLLEPQTTTPATEEPAAKEPAAGTPAPATDARAATAPAPAAATTSVTVTPPQSQSAAA